MSESERAAMAAAVFGRDMTELQWDKLQRLDWFVQRGREFQVGPIGEGKWLDLWSGALERNRGCSVGALEELR